MEKKENKAKWLHVRVSAGEHSLIHKRFKNTTCRRLSEYVRGKLLDEQLTTYYRNKSLDDFMAEMILLRKELNHIGVNFNQAVRRLNSMPHNADSRVWAMTYETSRDSVVKKVAEINNHIQKIAETWLQDLRQDHP